MGPGCLTGGGTSLTGPSPRNLDCRSHSLTTLAAMPSATLTTQRRTMREATIDAEGLVTVEDGVPIPQPGPREVLIKVVVSGSNPKDWKPMLHSHHPINTGDDIAGVVEAVGTEVRDLRPGTRVSAFHCINGPHSSWADYIIAPVHMIARIPPHVSFEEAATMPLAATTAAVALYKDLALPFPTVYGEGPPKTPLLIYGGSSAVGAYAIKFAVRSGIHPIITTAGSGVDYVKTLINPEYGDVIVDYRNGKQETVQALKDAAIALGVSSDGSIPLVLDAISSGDTIDVCIAMLPAVTEQAATPARSRFAHTMSVTHAQTELLDGKGVEHYLVLSCVVFQPDLGNLGYLIMHLIQSGMDDGTFRGHPYEVVDGGLDSLNCILQRLRDGRASAKTLVFYPGDVN